MPSALLHKLDEESRSLTALVENTVAAATAESRDLNEPEMALITSTRDRLGAINEQAAPIRAFMEARNASASLTAALPPPSMLHGSSPAPTQLVSRGLSEFVESRAFKSWGGAGRSDRFEMDGFSARAPLTEAASPGSLMLPQKQRFELAPVFPDQSLLRSVGYLPVSTNSVDLITYSNGAQTFAEVAEGAQKPEVAFTGTVETVNIPVIAGYIEATRQLLEDANSARAIIDSELRAGYYQALEKAAIAALTGATISTVTGASKVSLLGVIRSAMATVQATGYNPSTLLASPDTIATLDLDLMGKTLGGAQMGYGIWGLNVVAVPGLGATDVFVGDVGRGIVWLERTGVSIYVTDSHKDNFTKNVFTILAEGRSAFKVRDAGALRKVAVTP